MEKLLGEDAIRRVGAVISEFSLIFQWQFLPNFPKKNHILCIVDLACSVV
jgi:hypothetical protein